MSLAEKLSGSLTSIWGLLKASMSAEARAAYIELQGTAGDLINENRELRRQTAELEDAFQFKDGLTFRRSSYWKGPEDTFENGPYCSGCWDAQHQAIRLHPTGDGHAQCPVCRVIIKGLPDSLSPKVEWTTLRR